MSDIVEITEKHISPHVLPKESAVSWIKWIPDGVVFDRLILRYDSDVQIRQMFNVDDGVSNIQLQQGGQMIIPKDMLQINGFFGFEFCNTGVLDNGGNVDRPASFIIDVISGEKKQTIHLEHVVTVPAIKVVKSSPMIMRLSKSSVLPDLFSIELESLGCASAHDLTCVADVETNGCLQVGLVSVPPSLPKLFDMHPFTQKISVKGKGSGRLHLGIEYRDACDTKYFISVGDILIHVEESCDHSFPIALNLQNNLPLLTISHSC